MKRIRVSKTGLLISVKLVKLTLLVLALALGSGCGQLRPYVAQAPEESYGDGGFTSTDFSAKSTTTDGDFICPTQANIVPDYDRNFDGSGFFKGCKSSTNAYSVLIHGDTYANDTICIYPVQFIDASHVYLKPDQTGQPMVQCSGVTTGGVTATFDKTNFNALFIVEAQFKDQMTNCLKGGMYDFCPPYSYGRFR